MLFEIHLFTKITRTMRQIKNTLYLLSEGSSVQIEGEALTIRVNSERVRDLPLRSIENITMMCYNGWLSAETIRRCGDSGISINIGTPTGKFQVRVEGNPKGNILLRREQYRIADNEVKRLSFAKAFVSGKIKSQNETLRRKNRGCTEHEQAIKRMERLQERTQTAENDEELLGIEGEAAATYFSRFHTIIQNPGFAWTKRTRRPPKDEINALISFLYALATNDCKSACLATGLDPYCGLYHKDIPGRPSLALDLVEEFRCKLGDLCAASLINNKIIQISDFERIETPSHEIIEVKLTETGLKKVISHYQTRKNEEIYHPPIQEKVPWGLVPLLQARWLAKAIRECQEYTPLALLRECISS